MGMNTKVYKDTRVKRHKTEGYKETLLESIKIEDTRV